MRPQMRGLRAVLVRKRIAADSVECTLSCGHMVFRKNKDADRPKAMCLRCRAENPTRKEMLRRMYQVRASLSGSGADGG